MKKSCQPPHHIIVCIVTIIFQFMVLSVYAQQKDKKHVSEIRDISTIFEPGYILQDRNRDSVIDYINARIIIPDNPSETHLVCAAWIRDIRHES